MTPRSIAILAGSTVGLIVLAAAFFSWKSAFEDKAKMQQTITDMKAKFDEASKAMKQNQDSLQAKLDEIRKQVSQVKTPEQAARAIPAVIPGVQPIIVQAPQPAPPSVPSATTMAPPPPQVLKAEIPPEQLKTLYDFAQGCHETEAKLSSCTSDKAEMVKQMQAIEAQRDAAIKAAKGGSFWQRFRRDVRSGTGATAGAALGAAACASSKSSPAGIAVCAGAGGIAGFVVSHL